MAHSFAPVQIHAQHLRHPEAPVEALDSGRLSDADQHTACGRPRGKSGNNLFVLPGIAAAPGIVLTSGIDNDLILAQISLSDLIEINKADFNRQSGQRFIDVNQVVHPCLMKMSGQCPGTKLAPAVKHRDMGFQLHRPACSMQLFDRAEFIRDLFNRILKVQKGLGQMQIASQSDPVHGLPQQGSAHADPIFFRV